MSIRSLRKRGSTLYGNGYVDVELDAADLIEQLDDEDILQEVEKRKLGQKAKAIEPLEAFVEEALEALQRGDAADAMLTLERALRPKFPSLKLCEVEFENARKHLSHVREANQDKAPQGAEEAASTAGGGQVAAPACLPSHERGADR